jgi:hypothetical protein
VAEPIEPEDWEGLKPRPAGPDPARDARIDAYRDRERRRAAAALDRYIDTMFTPTQQLAQVAGERFVEAVGDYVLARLGERAGEVPAVVQRYLVDDKPRMAMDGALPLESRCDVFPTLACTPKREQCQTYCIRQGMNTERG